MMTSNFLSQEQSSIMSQLNANVKVFQIAGLDVAISIITSNSEPQDLSFLVQQSMCNSQVSAFYCIGEFLDTNTIVLIARSISLSFNVDEICLEFGGGGDISVAEARVTNSTVVEVQERLFSLLLIHSGQGMKISVIKPQTPVTHVLRTDPLHVAVDIFSTTNHKILVVVDGENKCVGLLDRETTERAHSHNLDQVCVEDFMGDFISVDEHANLSHVLDIILTGRQRLVPILDSNHCVTQVITRSDAVNFLMKESARFPVNRIIRNSSLAALSVEKLPANIYQFLVKVGELADSENLNVFVIGGFVRDLFLGKENDDIDLVIEEKGLYFADLLADKYGVANKTTKHLPFQTATIVLREFVPGLKIDIATARLEYYPQLVALPTIELSSLKMDLYRRDFTINAMAMQLNSAKFGLLFDFFNGKRDLELGRVAVLHSLSFLDDPTRIFRAIRFEQRCNFAITPQSLSLIRTALRLQILDKLSGSRLFHEFEKIFSETNPCQCMSRLRNIGVLECCVPVLFDLDLMKGIDGTLKDFSKFIGNGEKFLSWKLYVLAFSHSYSEEEYVVMCDRFQFASGTVSEIQNMKNAYLSAFNSFSLSSSQSQLYFLLRNLTLESIFMLITLTLINSKQKDLHIFDTANTCEKEMSNFWENYLSIIRKTKLSLDGSDLTKSGMKPGPKYKIILEQVLSALLDGKVANDKISQLNYVKTMIDI